MSQFVLSTSFEYPCYGFTAIRNNIKFFQGGDHLYTPESDVCRRQILMYKDDPRAEKVKGLTKKN